MKYKNIFLITVILIIILSIGLVNATTPTGGVSYYPFDEGTGTTLGDDWDSSDMTITGASWSSEVPNYHISGSAIGSLSFNGVSLETHAFTSQLDLDGLEEASISFWFKANDVPPSSTQYILYMSSLGTTGAFSFAHRSDGKIDFNFYTENDHTSGTIEYEVPNTNWNLLTATYDGVNFKGYANNVLLGTYAITGDVSHSSHDLTIGSHSNYGSAYDGYLTDIKFFDTGLTTTQISNLYNYGSIEGSSSVSGNYESAYSISQTDLVILNTDNVWTNIFSGSIVLNNSVVNYGSSTIQTLSLGTDAEFECRTLIDGTTSGDNYIRTNKAGQIGSMNLMRGEYNVSGTHNIIIQCKKEGGTTYINFSLGIGHVLSNETFYAYDSGSISVSDNNPFTQSYTYTPENNGVLILDWASVLKQYSIGSSKTTMNFNASNGESCQAIDRVLLGQNKTGSVGDSCLFNVEQDTNITIDFNIETTGVNEDGFYQALPNSKDSVLTAMSNFFDKNWNTYSVPDSELPIYGYMNYTIPNNITISNVKWQWKRSSTRTSFNVTDLSNYTVPNECLNQKLQIRVYDFAPVGESYGSTSASCYSYDSSSWITLAGSLSGTGLYDQGIFWEAGILLNTSINIKQLKNGVKDNVRDTILSTTPQTIANVTINNTERLSKVYMKAGLPISDSNNNVYFQYYVDGSSVGVPVPYTATNNITMSIQQYLADAPQKNSFEIELKAYRQTSGVNNIYIQGGNLVCYLTNEYPLNLTEFDITAVSDWSNTTINNFTVSYGGSSFKTIDGELNIFTIEDTLSFNISSDGRLIREYIDYNTSNNLEARLYQSVMYINITEQLSGNPIDNWALLNGTRVLINTTSNIGLFYPDVGEFNNLLLVSNVGAFSDRSLSGFNITALEQDTIFYQLFPTELTINASNILNDSTITSFSVTYKNLNNSHSGSYNTISGSLVMGVINYDTYNITIDAIGYATYNNTDLIYINGNTNKKFKLYTNNSINIDVRWESDNTLITQNVNILLTNSKKSYYFNTSTGSLYVDNIIDGTYSVKASTNGTDQKYYSISVASRSYQTLGIYFDLNYNNVTFIFQNKNTGQTIEGVYFSMNRFINDSLKMVTSKLSDVTGTIDTKYVEDVYYNIIAVKSGYAVKSFELDPIINDLYIVKMETSNQNIYIKDDIMIYYTPKFFNSNLVTFEFSIVSPLGFLTEFQINGTYPGGSFSTIGDNLNDYTNGNIFRYDIEIINPGLYDVFNLTYSYKTSMGSDVINTIYLPINYLNASSNSWANMGNNYPGLGLFERLIIAVLSVVLIAGFGFLIAGEIGSLVLGMFVYIFFTATGFIPIWTIIITLIMGFVLVIGGSKNS